MNARSQSLAAGDAEARQRRLELTRRAFKDFRAQCFWSYREDAEINEADVPWVIRELRHCGGATVWWQSANLPQASEALDLLHDEAAAVTAAAATVLAVLTRADYAVEVERPQPGFVRAFVGRGSGQTKTEGVCDSSTQAGPSTLQPSAFILRPFPDAPSKDSLAQLLCLKNGGL